MAALPTPITVRPTCLHCGSTDSSKLALSSRYGSWNLLLQPFERIHISQKLAHRGAAQDLIGSHWNQLKVSAMARVSVEEIDRKYTLATQVNKLEKGSSYLFRTEVGGQVKVSVRKKNAKYEVIIEVFSLQLSSSSDRLILSWGVYRSDSSRTQTLDLKSSVPGSQATMFETPFNQISDGGYALELELDGKQIPLFLSFILKSSAGVEIRNHMHLKFCVPVGFGRGRPSPMGLSFPADGSINFAVFSRNAEAVSLCLFNDASEAQPTLELDLDPYVNRSGDIWHVSLERPGEFTAYGYRFRGKSSENFDGSRIILDPYAKVLEELNNPRIALTSYSCRGTLSQVKSFDWTGDVRPNIPMERLMIYRLNVKRFTKHESSQLSADIAGTFYGLAEKAGHFKDLGVNAVLLEPIFPYDEQKGPYMPFNFFSPMSTYALPGDHISSINSMKDAVKRLHASGIEVFLEVNFTDTADSGALQGIDDRSYYHVSGQVETRRSLNCNYPVVQQFILESLRHLVVDYHIDGFCFMNASSLLRGFHGESLSRPPLVEAIAFDPILSRVKVIADNWDPIQAVHKDIKFPHWKRWAEMNTKFCSDVRNFLRGEGLLSDLATRLCGNGDLFSDGRGPSFSFNYIAHNFGLSLVDLVSFSTGELAAELSWNCGEEGPTNKTAVLERRLKQIRNFLFVLYLSLGVPVLNMGDECGYSTGGSPAYRDRKPLDWSNLNTGFGIQTSKFISFLSSFRQRRAGLFQKRNFLEVENIDWHGSNQSSPKWDNPKSRFLAMTLKPEVDTKKSSEGPKTSKRPGDLFIAFNGSDHSEKVILPSPPEGMGWSRLVDTAMPYPGFFSSEGEPVIEQVAGLVYEMKSHSCALFEATAPKG